MSFSLPLAPGNEVSNLLLMYDMEKLLRLDTIMYSSQLTEGGEIRKSSILESIAEKRGIH